MQGSFFLDMRGEGTECRFPFSYIREEKGTECRVPFSWIGDGIELPDSIDNLLALLCCYRQIIKTNDYSLVSLFSFGANLFTKHIVYFLV